VSAPLDPRFFWPDGRPRDQHVRRSGPDYLRPFLALLPLGIAWPRKPDSVLVRTCRGLSNIWGFVDGRAADLLERESDPRKTIELLPDWEASWGLPDPCFPSATTIGERQRMLVMVMTMLGGQSRAFFKWVADWIGAVIHMEQWTDTLGNVHNSSFHEWAPFMAGVSHVGETRMAFDKSGFYRWEIGPPEMRFYWTIEPANAAVIWFRASSGQAGVDPHVQVRTPSEIACLFRRWKPAQTEIVYDFSSLSAGGPLQGTP
jgi:uncharacterized protein YmfQ (DUF2313 family)